MKKRLALVFAAVLVIVACLTPTCFADDTANLPTWKPDPKIVAGLGSEFVLDGGAIKLPETLTLTRSKTVDHVTILKWRGPTAENGIRSELVMIAQSSDTLSDEDKKDPSLTAANLVSDATRSPDQYGLISGQKFDRQYFKGYNQRWLKAIHGFVYTSITDRGIYAFETFDEEPYSKYSLPVFEAAVLTFHQTDQPNSPYQDNLVDPDDAKIDQEESNQ